MNAYYRSKRIALMSFAIVALASGLGAEACRDLRRPEHLTANEGFLREHYLVVQIESTVRSEPVDRWSRLGIMASAAGQSPDSVGLAFDATILESFGDVDRSGQHVRVEFFANEEAHAVCPILVHGSQRFLLRSKGRGDVLTLSRYDQMNISADDDKFETYLADLRALRDHAKRQGQKQMAE